jgi:DamX protein
MPKPDFQFDLEDALNQPSKATLRDPFGSKDASVYFASEEGNQQLALLEHLSRYSSLLSVVQGPQGSGKSRFLMEFARNQDDSTIVSHVKASMLMTAGQLLPAIYAGFAGHFSQPPNETTFGPLLKFSHELEEKGQSSLILIDNAQELNTDAVSMLLDMMSLATENQTVPHVVLFSEFSLARNLDAYQSSRYEQLSHSFTLAPYSLEQTRAYLLHRVRAVGGGINLPFNEKQVTQIYLESGGYPGRINTIAQTMMGKGKSTKSGKKFSLAMGFPLAHMALLSVVMLGILVAVLFSDQTEDSKTVETVGNVIPLSPRQGQSSEETIARMDAMQRNIGQKNDLVLPVFSAETSLPAISMSNTSDAESVEESAPQSAIPTAPIISQAPLVEAVKPAPVVSEPKIEPTAVTPADPFNKTQWWLSQNPNRYTLQLLGTHNINAVKDFIRDQGSVDAFGYFKALHNGKDWYVVVYGTYRNRSEAIAASESLPKDIRDLNPWARSARGIQDDIKKTQ